MTGGQTSGNCDFKASPSVDLCSWTNVNLSAFKWLPSTGSDAHWIGGPKKDQTDGNKNGGYAFFETSQLPNSAKAANTVNLFSINLILLYFHQRNATFLKHTFSCGKLRLYLNTPKN